MRRYLAGFGWGSLTTLASSGTFLYVALLAVNGQVTLGALTVFTQAAAQVQGAFQGILGGIQGIYENGLYLSTLYELLEREPRIHAPEHPAPVRRPFRQGIEFRNVSYRYPGPGSAGAGQRLLHHRAGADGRPGRTQRRRQVDGGEAARSPLRPG